MWLLIIDFLKTFWKPILAVLAFVAVVFSIYHAGVNSGEAACMKKWQAAEKARIEAINKQITKINETSNKLAEEQNASDKKLAEDIGKIIKGLKDNINKIGKDKIVYTTVENCKPSDAFVERWNEISNRTNAK